MKRGKKLLALLLLLVLLLGAAYGAARLNPEKKAEEETVYTTVFTLDPGEVTQIGWDYSEALSFTKEEGGWVYDADSAFPLDETYIDAMLETLKELRSTKTIEAVENWDQYTLEVPICEITVTTGDTTRTLKIGEETALGGQRYLSIGDGNAYLVDSSVIDPFRYGLYDVLKMESVPDMSSVMSMEFVSGGESYEIRRLENSGLAYSDEYIWFLGEKPLDTDLTEKLLRYVTDMTWQECVNYHAGDLSKYGLDTPAAVITVRYLETVQAASGETGADENVAGESQKQEKTYTLEIGAEGKDGYYVRIQDSRMIYQIPANVAETLLYTTYADLLPDEVLLMDWDAVKAMEITLDGETYTIQRTLETVEDDEGNETEEVVYRMDGEEVNAASIPEALDALVSTGYAAGLTPERGEEIRFVIKREHATFPEVELVIYQYNSTSCLVTLNGEATVFVAREDAVSLVEKVNALVLK